jgi:hypothetical protein
MVYSPKEILDAVKPGLKLSAVQKDAVNDLVSKVMAALKEDALVNCRTEVDLQGKRWVKSYDFSAEYKGIIIEEAMKMIKAKGWDVTYSPREINHDYLTISGAHPALIDRFYITPKQKSKEV